VSPLNSLIMRKLYKALSSSSTLPAFRQPKNFDGSPLTELLYRSQLLWLTDSSQMMIAEKGRQIGFSWVDSLKSVIEATRPNNPRNTYYTSFNRDTTENYIRYATKWAQSLGHILGQTAGIRLIDDKDTLMYRLRFLNGFSITALAGNAVNLRDKSGAAIVVDEAAFRLDLPSIIDAATACVVWGGSLRVFSTHFGIDSPFNTLIGEAQQRNFSHHRIPFRLAVDEGLYKRVCIRTGQEWTKEKESRWVDGIYRMYGAGASQELDCIPSDNGGLGLFKNILYTSCVSNPETVFRIRSWDLAATEKNGCYSVGCLMCYDTLSRSIVLEDVIEGQWGALDGDNILISTAKNDGPSTYLIIEAEAGSESIRWQRYIIEQLRGYNIQFIRPSTDKLTRAIPLANAFNLGNLKVVDSPHNRDMMSMLKRFSAKKQPLITDLCDSLAQGYTFLANHFMDTMLGL